MPKLPIKISQTIKAVRDTATMETASFSFPNDYYVSCDKDGTPRPGAAAITLDALIKEKTGPWRNSWLIKPLDSVLKWSDPA